MILKFLSGGTAPFVQYLPLQINTARAAGGESSSKNDSSSSSSKNDGKLTQKDLLTMLKDIDGLPSDMEALYNNMVNFMRMGEVYGDIDTSMLSTQYIRALRNVKTAIFRKEVFDNAYDRAKENGGLNEVAITDTGKILGLSKDGKIETFNPNEFDSENYLLLTNSDVLNIRANDINYANNDYLSQVVSNGIGMEKINGLVHDYVTKLGTTNIEKTGIYKNPLLKAEQGLIALQELQKQGIDVTDLISKIQEQIELSKGASIKGLYKYNQEISLQVEQANYALNYIYQMLPQNAKTLLEVKTGSKEGSLKLLNTLIASGMSYSNRSEWTPLTEKSSSSSSSDGTGSSDAKTNQVLNIQNGIGGDVSNYTFNAGSQAEMSVYGTNYRSIVGQDGKTISDTDISDLLASSGIQGIVDKSNVYFGNLKLNPDRLNKVIYRNNGATRVFLPSIKDKNGKVRPMFEILDIYLKEVVDKVNKECGENATFEQRQQATLKYIKRSSLTQLLDSSGNIDKNKFTPYLLVDSYVRGNDVKLDDNNKLVERVSDDDEDTYNYVEEVLNKGKDKDSDKEELDKKSGWDYVNPLTLFRGFAEDIYKGVVFIPITSQNKLAATTAYGDLVKYNTGINDEAEYQRFLKLQALDEDIGWQN